MANDPYYDSRFLIDGTPQAEMIYNELIARQKTAHGTIKSRVLSVPPGSPSDFDAYLVATGGTGLWDTLDGNLVVWLNSWIVMVPKVGMTFLIEDEDMLVGVDSNGALAAWDGCQTIVPDGSGNIVWDVALGATAYVVLTLASNELKAPINMKAGRLYTIFFEQNASSLEVHFEPGEWIDLNGGDLDTGAVGADIDHFGFIGPSCASAKPTQIFHTGAGAGGGGGGPHAADHSLGGSDTVTVENLRTGAINVDEVLKSAGGNALVMGPLPNHATTRHQFGQADALPLNTQAAGSTAKYETLQPKTDGSSEWVRHISSRSEGSMTGLFFGWQPTGFAATTISLGSGEGLITDNATSETDPTQTPVAAGPYVTVTVTAVATAFATFFYVDSGGLLQQQITKPTLEEERSRIYVAVATHETGSVTRLYPIGTALYEGWQANQDLLRIAGLFNAGGNDYSRDTVNALGLEVTAGAMFSPEINRDGTALNRRNPNTKSQALDTDINFIHFQDDGTGSPQLVTSPETDIDVLQRDDGAGGLSTMANNRNTLNIIYRDPDGRTAVQYTQVEYNPSNSTATEEIQSVKILLNKPWLPRYAIDIPKSISDLNDATFFELNAAGSIGGGGGSGSPTTSVQRSVVLTIVAPHVVEANTGTQFSPRTAGQIEELYIIPGVLTEVAGGTFSVELFKGPNLASLVSVGVVSLVGAANSGVLVPGSPVAFSANDIFVANTTFLGTFPIGTLSKRKKLYLHVRFT